MNMKAIFSIIMVLFLFGSSDLIAQKYQKKASKSRKDNRNSSNAKSAYKVASKPLYLDGMKSVGIYGNKYDENLMAGIMGEYFLSHRLFVGGYAEYFKQEYFDSNRVNSTIGADMKAFVYSVNNTLHIVAKAGVNYTHQKLNGIEPSRDIPTSLYHGVVGGEVMIHILHNVSVYTDLRNYYAFNDQDNSKLLWTIGAKLTIH